MLTSTHFAILAGVFTLSIALGVVLRIVYHSNNNFNHTLGRIKNIFVLQVLFPFLAYQDIKKHKTEYIAKINKDTSIPEKEKAELRKRIASNRKILWVIVFNSVKRFKRNLDLQIEFLNRQKEKHGFEIRIVVEFEIRNVKEEKEEKEIFENNVMNMFAY